jgi:CheY-specific phosphatase CheX
MPITPLMIADIEQLIGSCVTDVFGTMLSMDVHPASPSDPADPPSEAHVASAVGFSGVITGVVYIYTSSSFARRCAGSMLGLTDAEIDGDEMVNDVMGEIANMVVGNLKSGLCDRGLTCVLTIPSIVRGKFSIEPISSSERKVFHFTCESRPLLVEVMIKHSSERAA